MKWAAAEGGAALDELEALFDDMGWMHRQSSGGMDPGRIRAAFGLGTGRTVVR